jgi:hypothetical protein
LAGDLVAYWAVTSVVQKASRKVDCLGEPMDEMKVAWTVFSMADLRAAYWADAMAVLMESRSVDHLV